MELKLFSTQINPDLHKKLRILAVNSDRKIIDLVDEGIKDLVEKYKDLET